MSKAKLNQEEQELLDAFEAGEFESVSTEERKKRLALSAEDTFKKDKRINIRISGRDLAALQNRALAGRRAALSVLDSQRAAQIRFRKFAGSHCSQNTSADKSVSAN